MPLDWSQKEAIQGLQSNAHIACLVGPAGRGKTFTIQAFLEELNNLDKVYLAAPTGKAAQVIEESISISVPNKPKTIHRLLQCKGPNKWEINHDNPLDAEIIIVDESSMIGSSLMSRLIVSAHPECKFIFVGDDKQLPPVSPGQPFRDLVKQNKNVFCLKINHRQEHGCSIADACELIRKSKPFKFKNNLSLIEEEDHQAIIDNVIDWWVKSGQKDQIVLIPQRTTKIGVDEINKAIKLAVNPGNGSGFRIKGTKIHAGDRVIQTVNNYQLKVFNGQIGTVLSVDNNKVCVDFGREGYIEYDDENASGLQLGYAITIHKSQGSQWKHGAIIASKSHTYMWTRCLLYTALSRFKETCVVIGDTKTLKRAIKNNKDIQRRTYLGEELK